MIRKRVIYQGRVQGVGFRYTARSVASSFPVAGWVRNLDEGDVELVVEGEPEQVDAFLTALATRMARNLERVNVQEEPPSGLSGFTIRH
jgi:acylphosphatase